MLNVVVLRIGCLKKQPTRSLVRRRVTQVFGVTGSIGSGRDRDNQLASLTRSNRPPGSPGLGPRAPVAEAAVQDGRAECARAYKSSRLTKP